MLRHAIALVLVLAATFAATPARAHGIGDLTEEAGDLPEVRRLVELHAELHELIDRYLALEAEAGRGWLAISDAVRDAEDANLAAEDARRRLDERVRTAFEFGPGGSLEALLGASSFAELALISEYTARTISVDDAAVRDTLAWEAVSIARRARAEAARDALGPKLERLRTLLEELRAKVAKATTIAEQAHVDAQAFEAQQRAIGDAVLRAGSWDLGVIGYGQDQSHLLSLLGPTGGQSCETPAGLVETGESFAGYASWYGWEFGGQPTATGAIFDPRLFTAASRTLPFGTFLRVRHADRCAVVLINDRGPYGRLERVIDLSQAAAEYLGVGVSWVNAEILVPQDDPPS
ncbi:MAG: RlpA-like double-psi beta-barrel domain-containing protein [Actinomycetota bacterium]